MVGVSGLIGRPRIDRLDTEVKSQRCGLNVDKTALQWHVTVVLLLLILDKNFN